MKGIIFLFLVFLAAFLPACSQKLSIVQPFEREHFAQDKMLFTPMESRTEHEGHIFLIREASAGGESSFQGGCGCR